jgi:hypothetical protein
MFHQFWCIKKSGTADFIDLSHMKCNLVAISHFELFSDLNAGNSLEIQEKFERLNQMMSHEWQGHNPAKRMFLSQSK